MSRDHAQFGPPQTGSHASLWFTNVQHSPPLNVLGYITLPFGDPYVVAPAGAAVVLHYQVQSTAPSIGFETVQVPNAFMVPAAGVYWSYGTFQGPCRAAIWPARGAHAGRIRTYLPAAMFLRPTALHQSPILGIIVLCSGSSRIDWGGVKML